MIFLFFIFLFLIPSSFAYIDPGTGGYLISSIWSFIIGFIALFFGIIIRFFRHTLKNFILKLWKKNKYLFILYIVVILFSIIGSIYFFIGFDYELPEYDSSLDGVHFYNKELVNDGYNLYNGKLIDNDGNLINSWNYSYLSILDDEGNYYAQRGYETLEWGKFDWNDNPIWIKEIPIHHEIYMTLNNTIITFTKETHNYNGRLVEFDVILEYDKEGNEISRWSIWDNLKMFQKFHRPLELDEGKDFIIPEDHMKNTSIWGANYDYYHLNAFSEVPDNSMESVHPAFKKGNWIISFRHGSMIFILDKDTKEVLWRAIYDQVDGNIEGQHSPFMLSNGNIVIFDNGRYREKSRIIELNPVNLSIVWEYNPKNFFTYSQGYVQLLSNGNYLVTESEIGHVFEITKEKEKVWEFYTNDTLEKDSKIIRNEIYRMYRYDEDFIEKFI